MEKKNPYRALIRKLASLDVDFDFCSHMFSAKQWKKIQRGLLLLYGQIIRAAKYDDYCEDDFNFSNETEQQGGHDPCMRNGTHHKSC